MSATYATPSLIPTSAIQSAISTLLPTPVPISVPTPTFDPNTPGCADCQTQYASYEQCSKNMPLQGGGTNKTLSTNDYKQLVLAIQKCICPAQNVVEECKQCFDATGQSVLSSQLPSSKELATLCNVVNLLNGSGTPTNETTPTPEPSVGGKSRSSGTGRIFSVKKLLITGMTLFAVLASQL
ncbi:5735_t:CDS:1 [Paraglomus occultum]|uniref:5735_t:CDS:1 n=1 Tax=Paraglomus occultum TaxID=144539 RepID=A0A9N9E9U1_9GLOM|nr:5735_t:CDS:1 [Paraglomus occultum]